MLIDAQRTAAIDPRQDRCLEDEQDIEQMKHALFERKVAISRGRTWERIKELLQRAKQSADP